MTDLSRWVGLPYEPGGRGPRAFDCWGLVAHVLAALYGVSLPRLDEAEARAPDLSGWARVPAPRFGDVAFWPAPGGGHCGVFADPGRVLHAHAVAGRSLISAVEGMLLPAPPQVWRREGRA